MPLAVGGRALELISPLLQPPHEIHRIEAVVLHAHRRDLVGNRPEPRRPLAAAQVLGRIGPGVDGDDDETLDPAVVHPPEDESVGRLPAGHDRPEPDIVRQASIHQVDVFPVPRHQLHAVQGPVVASLVRRGALERLDVVLRGRRSRRRRIAPEAERAQQDRKGRGRGDGARNLVFRQIGAEEVELLLRELKARAVGETGGVHDDERPPGRRDELHECPLLEDGLVVELGREIDAAPVGRGEPRPVDRAEHPPEQLALDVTAEKAVLELREDAVAEEPVVGGGEGAARHRGDAVDLAEKGHRRAAKRDGRLAKRLHHTVGEGGRPRAPAGEGEAHEQLVGLFVRQKRVEAVAAVRPVFREPRVQRIVRARRDEEAEGPEEKDGRRAPPGFHDGRPGAGGIAAGGSL